MPLSSAPAAAAAGAAPSRSAAPAHSVAAADEDDELARAIAASLADSQIDPSSQPAKAARTDDGPPSGSGGGGGGAGASLGAGIGSGGGGGGGDYEDDGTVAQRRVIDSDNACLFNAVGYVMARSLREAPALRKVIADAAGGSLTTSTRPTSNRRTESARLYERSSSPLVMLRSRSSACSQ